MIIEGHSSIFKTADFIEGLNRATRGVLRVATASGQCSAWQLTDRLIVVPDYISSMGTSFQVYPFEADPVEAKLITTHEQQTNGSQPALLELSQPLTARALTLETASPMKGDPIIVLQYPSGKETPHFSMGYIAGIEGIWIDYDADTEAGAGGSPVINLRNWTIIGMHTIALQENKVNRGVRIDPMLDAFKTTSVWPDIVKHHKLADIDFNVIRDIAVSQASRFKAQLHKISSETGTTFDPLLQAALCWSIDPAKVRASDREALQSLVVDSSVPAWTLKTNERQRILKSAGAQAIQQQQKRRFETDETGQAVINSILKGPPYHLEEVKEEYLPYWLQAVRWFENVIPDLPSAADVNTTLQRKRTRSRLLNIISGFRGRNTELETLHKWFDDDEAGPMLITGIGGMGKSALVGYFSYKMPEDTLLLWLDFDRPDLAPDDAVSVLNVIAEQASIQLPGFSMPEIEDEEKWKETAKELGMRLANATASASKPLLILDGFEVAQHAKEYHEIWQLLEVVLAELPRLKVIISGRAPVKSLVLNGRHASPLALKGLARPDAEAWLRERGISDEKILSAIIELSEGVPLRLKLAVRLIDAGEKIEEIPARLPKEYITGYLYQRILYRLIDPSLIPLVKDALILRRCSKEMMIDMLSDKFPEGLRSDEVYERLSREMALVGDAENLYGSFVIAGDKPNTLELRPEVRSATLRLLEAENAQQVRSVDEKAVDWYQKQDMSDADNVAELIYHLLRLKRLDEAKKHWRIECAPVLKMAPEDFPEGSEERKWLEQQVGEQTIEAFSDSLISWEIQTALEIRNKLTRGLIRGLSETLSFRKERSTNSPLLVYDAFNRWNEGDLSGAIAVIESARPEGGIVVRDLKLFHAFLSSQTGDWKKAFELLEDLEHSKWWQDSYRDVSKTKAVHAARIRLTVDIEGELKLLEQLHENRDPSLTLEVRKFLTPADVILPLWTQLFGNPVSVESYVSSLPVPYGEDEQHLFRLRVQDERFKNASFAISIEDDVSREKIKRWRERLVTATPLPEIVFDLAYKGYVRWRLATSDATIFSLFSARIDLELTRNPLDLSIISTLAAFRGQPISYNTFRNIDDFLQNLVKENRSVTVETPSVKRFEILKSYFRLLQQSRGIDAEQIKEWANRFLKTSPPDYQDAYVLYSSPSMTAVSLYMLGPDPLELLCKSVLGLPDNYKLVP